MVDLVRRRNPPPYARSATWINWTNAGGIVWLFVWLWVILHLLPFAMFHGFSTAPARGVDYTLPEHDLYPADLVRLAAGQTVFGPTGEVLIDPQRDDVTIYAATSDGKLDLRYASQGDAAVNGHVIVLLVTPAADYQQVVTVVESMQERTQDARIWFLTMNVAARQHD